MQPKAWFEMNCGVKSVSSGGETMRSTQSRWVSADQRVDRYRALCQAIPEGEDPAMQCGGGLGGGRAADAKR